MQKLLVKVKFEREYVHMKWEVSKACYVSARIDYQDNIIFTAHYVNEVIEGEDNLKNPQYLPNLVRRLSI
jgi:uncharacterized lipoprotein YbaY